MPDLFLPPGVRYTCIRCGACCRSLEVTMTDAEHERLAARDWSPELPGYREGDFFAALRGHGRQTWRLRPLPSGACRFLTADNLCQVHATLGLAAKPFAGRLYPFTFQVTPLGVFVGCRFNCPAVVRGIGPDLEDQRRDIEALFREYARLYEPPREPDRVRFFGRYELGWRDILRLEDQLLAFLLTRSLDVPRRLLACRRLARGFVAQALRKGEPGRLGVEPEGILDEVRGRPAGKTGLSATERVMMRLLSATLLGAELPSFHELSLPRRAAVRLRNLGRRLKVASGLGRMVLPGTGAAVPLGAVRGVDPTVVDEAGAAMLERYFVVKVASQGFFGRAFFGRSFVEGLDFLACTYGAIVWTASAHAALAGRRALAADDIEYAISQVDYGFNYIGSLGGPTERMRTILFWQWETPERLLRALSRAD